jgi:hypothetical protein
MKFKKDEAGKLILDEAGDPIPIEEKPKKDGPKMVEGMTQAKLEELLNEQYRKGASNSADAQKLATLQQENEDLKAAAKKLEDAKRKGPKSTESGEDFEARIQALTEGYEEKLGAIQTQLDTERTAREEGEARHQLSALETQVVAGAGKANAIDPNEVFVLMQNQGYFKQDPDNDGNWAPVNPKTGKIRIDVDAGGETMTIAKAVDEFMNDHAHLMRGSKRTGSGQGDGRQEGDREVPSPTGVEDVDNMAPSEVYANRRKLIGHIAAGGKGGVAGGQTVS